jgi:N-acetylglucosamine kinase-like BadF-type ATPase
MTLLLGIDGGGTKTTALLAEAGGGVLGRGQTGSSNYHAVGAATAFDTLREAVHAAFGEARRTPLELEAVCLGLAGAGRAPDRALFTDWAEREWPDAERLIVNDAELVLAAGTPQGWGLALICGTGSIAFGKTRQGRTARAGGWGYLLGDEGGGYAIGLAALHAIVRAHDGRAPLTALTPAILARWRLAAPTDLIAHVYQPRIPHVEIAELAPLVEQAAAEGDEAATEILQTAGNEMAELVQAAANRLGLGEPTPCALAGGVILNGPLTRRFFQTAADRQNLRLEPITAVPEPAQGALALARQLVAPTR